jgi:hypothetical protein
VDIWRRIVKHQTQGRRIIEKLKHGWYTYLEMQMLCVSTSPHKRVMESLGPDERLDKDRGSDGLIRWKVVKANPEQSAGTAT